MAVRPGKRRYSGRSNEPSPHRNGQARVNTLSVRPCEPSDDDGWQLRASWADRLFWWHPSNKLKQWATPENVQPALWRVCFEKDGSRSYCHMETSQRQHAPPKAVNQGPIEAPWDWIEERGADGSISWFNPRMGAVSRELPASLLNAPRHLRCEWQTKTDEKGVYHIHSYTREYVRRMLQQELNTKTFKLSGGREPTVMDDSEPQGKKVIAFDAETLRRNRGNAKFTKSLFVRYQALQQANEQPSLDGSMRIVSSVTGKVLCQLTPEETEVYHHNTHLKQLFLNGKALERAGSMTPEHRYVRLDQAGRLAPRMVYQRRQREAKTTEFWYLRGWLIADLEFLLAHAKPQDTVVMELSIACHYITMLASTFFPDLNFIVFCEAPMDLSALSNVKLYVSQLDTNKLQGLDNSTTLFITHATVTDFPAGVATPPQLQRWRSVIQASSPRAALTTFQLPWPDVKGRSTSNYFDGELRYPVWGQQTGCECVLVVTDLESEREWHHKDYEELMFHFNTQQRTQYFDHPNKAEGIDACYDCAAETMALTTWLERKGITESVDLAHELASYSTAIHSQVSATGRTLANWKHYLTSNMI
eukprot:m.37484 g.37484  ORF g.37484 m.37484 type:complete len:589 (-) comp12508_c0_seq1:71-1837(-)